MDTIDVDKATFDSINFAARMSGMTPGEIVARMVKERQMSTKGDSAPSPAGDSNSVDIYVDYEGHRTMATFHRQTKRVDITDGPLAGKTFKTPSSAARAVVAHYKPTVNSNRNGWTFWMLADGTGRFLQSIR